MITHNSTKYLKAWEGLSTHIHALKSCGPAKFDLGILIAIAKKDTINFMIQEVKKKKSLFRRGRYSKF